MILEPGKVACLFCKYLGDRFEVQDCYCRHPAFLSTDFLGGIEKKRCSVINASKNCNGYELKGD